MNSISCTQSGIATNVAHSTMENTLKRDYRSLQRCHVASGAQKQNAVLSTKSLSTKGTTLKYRERLELRSNFRRRSFRVLPTSVVCLSTKTDVEGFISQGPLTKKLELSASDIKENLSWWKSLADVLCKHLDMDPENLSDAESRRIFHYYLPVYRWFEKTLAAHRAGSTDKPLVVGISAPQGCGKTTLVTALEVLFNHQGITAATISIDDFYLTFEDQQALAAANPDNDLLQYRGNAGSHDLNLGTNTIEKLLQVRSEEDSAATPRYDKSKQSGRGDRAAEDQWPIVQGPLDVVLFEGWMSGFSPLPTEEVAAVDPQLVSVNEALKEYASAWDQYCDAWLVVKVQDYNWVQKWRLQAEVAMRNAGKPSLSDEQVQDFVNRFLPAYKAYLPGLYENGPSTSSAETPLLFLEVDEARNVQG